LLAGRHTSLRSMIPSSGGLRRANGSCRRIKNWTIEMIKSSACLIVVVTSCLSGCATDRPPSPPYAVLNPDWIRNSVPGGGPGPKWGDFRRAAASPTFREAARRWQAVIDRYGEEPADSFEDGLDVNMWLGARRELMRAYYATGETAKADAILKELEKYW